MGPRRAVAHAAAATRLGVVRSAPYTRAQVHIGHHAPLLQKGVGLAVFGRQLFGQRPLQHIGHLHQGDPVEAALDPPVHQGLHQHVRPQDVTGHQLGTPFELLHTHTQVVEAAADLLDHGQRHARGKNLVLHHIVAHQLQAQGVGAHPDGGIRRRLHPVAPGLGGGAHPGGPAVLVGAPHIASQLVLAGRGNLVQQRGQKLLNRLVHAVQPLHRPGDKTLAHQLGQLPVMRGGSGYNHGA